MTTGGATHRILPTTTGQDPTPLYTTFHRDELDIIAAACSLNEKPGKNWVENAGGLPDYICRIARAIKHTGKTTSQAVAIAVSRVKKWAAGAGDVNADTRAKAARALVQWEQLKAKAGKTKALRASHTNPYPDMLCLAAAYNTDIVRAAFDAQARAARQAWHAANPNGRYDDAPATPYIKELWNKYLITQSGYGDGKSLHKVDYTVDANGTDVTFADPIPVKVEYVTITDDDTGADITDAQLQALMAATAAVDSLTLGLSRAFAGLAGLHLPSAPIISPQQTSVSPLQKFIELAASAQAAKPYGDVTYADPGYQADKKKRYPVNTVDHVRAAWAYINQQKNAAKYTAAQLKAIKGRIKAAAVRLGVQIAD